MHEIQFHIYMHIFFLGVPSMYCSLTNYLDPISLGTILLECVLGTWRCIGCLSHLQWKCLHHMLIGAKRGWLMKFYLLHQPNVISVTSIHPHAYFSSIQPYVGWIMAWNFFYVPLLWFLQIFTRNFFMANESKLRWLHIKGMI